MDPVDIGEPQAALANDIGRRSAITQMPGKVVSLFEPHTEIIRKGKASKPTEFGKLVQLQEAENQIITHYEVFEERPSDRELLLSSVEAHRRKLGRVPHMSQPMQASIPRCRSERFRSRESGG